MLVTYWCASALLRCFSEAEPKWTLCSGKPLQEQRAQPHKHTWNASWKSVSYCSKLIFWVIFMEAELSQFHEWFLKIYFKDSWLTVYHFPLIDILIWKVEKIKLLGDSSILTRALQKLATLCTKFLFPLLLVSGVCRKTKVKMKKVQLHAHFLMKFCFRGIKWRIVYISRRGGRDAKKLAMCVTTRNKELVKSSLVQGASDQPRCLLA